MRKITLPFIVLAFLSTSVSAQLISTVAGNGSGGFSGDGGQATAAEIQSAYGLAIDATGNIYIADQANCRVRKVNTNGVMSTLAGTGVFGYSGDGGQATAAKMGDPSGVAVDAAGNVYIGDANNARTRKVTVATGIITTVAGNGVGGFSGDGGQATAAEVNGNSGIWIAANGTMYIGDMSNQRVRKVTTAGVISTYAGNGTAGFSGDGGQATAAELNGPDQITTDATGNLYISDYSNNRVRKVTTAGVISTIAGTGVAGYNGDGIQATAAQINGVESCAIDAGGNIYLGDLNERVRRIAPNGIISTYAGTGVTGYNGDGIQATTAEIFLPTRVAVDNAGTLYINDEINERIRKVGGVPLPVKLLTFTAEYNEAMGNVGLNWVTATETNNKYFTIERSTDGENFSDIAEVAGAGNSTVTLYYNTIDPSPIPGIDYYRLKQTDLDGNYQYSAIVPVNVPFNFLLYPNPANNLIHIITPVSGKTLVRVYNMLGSELIANSYTNQSNIDLAVSNLPNGVYLVRIQTDNGNSWIKRVEINR